MSEAATVETGSEDGCEGARTVRLRIPAAGEYVTLARLALGGLADLAGISDETLTELKVALTEAVATVAREADGRPVEIDYELAAGELRVDVGAGGVGHGPVVAAGRLEGDVPPDDGLAVPIIRTVADDLEHEPGTAAGGPRFRFAKRLRADG